MWAAVVGMVVAAGMASPAGAGRSPISGGHAAPGAVAGSTQWIFAEGYTGPGFHEYLTFLNPLTATAHVRIQPIGANAPAVVRSVDALDRLTVRVAGFVEGSREVGFVVTADRPVVAERATYFAATVGQAGAVDGGHVALGATAASTSWYFAEGFTGTGFQEYLTLLNPSLTETAHGIVRVGGVRLERELPPRSRATLDVNAAVGPGREVAAEVSSDVPIVAERPVYFSRVVAAAGPVDGGHVAMGATEARAEWWFAEGFTGGGFQEYLAVGNPGDRPAPLNVTAHLEDGSTRVVALDAPAHGRATIDVVGLAGPEHEVSLHVTAASPVLAERPTYFRRAVGAAGLVDGGHVAFGSANPSTTWLFAEGNAGGSFQEYLTVLNPGGIEAKVPVVMVFPDGPTRQATLSVPARARRTLDVRQAAGQPRDVALIVGPATQPVVAERPVYFSTSVET